MATKCSICDLEKETRAAVIPIELAKEKESSEWYICETCESAYQVVQKYLQGQNQKYREAKIATVTNRRFLIEEHHL